MNADKNSFEASNLQSGPLTGHIRELGLNDLLVTTFFGACMIQLLASIQI